MKKETGIHTFPDPSFRRSRYGHAIHLLILCLVVGIGSTAATFYSLGFKINLAARSIEQTGLISVDSPLGDFRGLVFLNGKEVSDRIPYRSQPLFPGHYEVRIEREGYQTWSRALNVEANRVANFRSVVMIKKEPVVQSGSESDRSFVLNGSADDQDIEVRQNELWIDGKFITRTSADIGDAIWFPGHSHVAYQLNDEIVLAEPDGLQTQLLATLPDDSPALMRFKDGGRTLVYAQGENVWIASLY